MLGSTVVEIGNNCMKLTTNFPPEVHAITYVKNSHFLELEDDDGNRTKLDASGVVRYVCEKCGFIFLAFENHGNLSCPDCGELGASKPTWMVPQISFVPEKETPFMARFKMKDHK